ncbi:MAG: 2-hydroxyacyl-CoA dehydratase, partial [Selenomonadales bacterium]|nr:2-hydroxyacyl-CoA dehydratase [Selenomonadales bacterium]
DGEINHGLPELLTSYGLVVLSEDALPAKEMPKLRVVNQWTYHARLYAAAEFIRDYPNLELMQMSSFGCGLDAVTIDQVKELLDANQKIYTIIKLDEINNLGAARIRVRSLLAVLEDRKEHPMVIPPRAEEEPRRRYTADMKETHTILAPQLSPIHFDILLPVLARFGYRVVIPPLPSPSAIAEGLKYVNNEMCYPTIVVVGQLLQALQSGQYDLDKTSIILFQSGGACRATNYLALMRKALKDAGMGQVPVFAAWGKDTDDFKLTLPMMHDVIKSMIYGDLLMRVLHRVRPYEQVAGSADALYRKWADHCKGSLLAGKSNFNETIRRIVAEFDSLPIHEDMIKPKVGIVGEILVKYHPTANNHIVELLEREGCEVVLPDFIDFFLYCAYDNYVKHKYLSGKLENKLKAGVFIKAMDFYRHTMNKELARSRRFHPTKKITAIAKDAEKHVSLGNMAGEGWLLTADMLELIKMGADNIVCLQPFGCLPNHIVGKGMVRELLRSYPKANIAMIDCDAGASEVNQENRIKLMVAVAKEKIAQQLAEKA